jgi:hypothetical protein
MITYDQLERKEPRADLIRLRSLGGAIARRSIEVVYVASNTMGRYEEAMVEGSKAYQLPLFSKIHMVQLFWFYLASGGAVVSTSSSSIRSLPLREP